MKYEDLIGDINDFGAAFEYWLNAYNLRGEEITRLEDKIYSMEVDQENLQNELERVYEQLEYFQRASGF